MGRKGCDRPHPGCTSFRVSLPDSPPECLSPEDQSIGKRRQSCCESYNSGCSESKFPRLDDSPPSESLSPRDQNRSIYCPPVPSEHILSAVNPFDDSHLVGAFTMKNVAKKFPLAKGRYVDGSSGEFVYPCGSCSKQVRDHHEAILCHTECRFWFHKICTGLPDVAFRLLTLESEAAWICARCDAANEAKEAESRQAAAREASARNAYAREAAAREAAARKAAAESAAFWGASVRRQSAWEAAARAAEAKEKAIWEATVRESAAREAAARGAAAGSAAIWGACARRESPWEAAAREKAIWEATVRAAAAREAAAREAAAKEAAAENAAIWGASAGNEYPWGAAATHVEYM